MVASEKTRWERERSIATYKHTHTILFFGAKAIIQGPYPELFGLPLSRVNGALKSISYSGLLPGEVRDEQQLSMSVH